MVDKDRLFMDLMHLSKDSVRTIFIGMVVGLVTRFKYEGLDLFIFAFVLGCGS